MYKWVFCFFLFLGPSMCIALPTIAFSEVAEEPTAVYTLGEVIVTAETGGVESIGTVREITARDIEAKGARTLDEALELLPGLDVRTGADGVPRVNLRGFRSRHVLLLLDGIPFNSTYDGQFDPSFMPVENIAKIKVSYGTNSVLYGQGGLGGVINIITKKAKKGFRGKASGEIGERDSYLGDFNLSGAREKMDFFLSGSAFDTDGFPVSDDFQETSLEDGGVRENSDRRRNNLFANVGFAPNEETAMGVIVNYVKGEFGKPPSTLTKADDPDFAKNPKFLRVEDLEGLSSQFSISSDLPGPLEMRGWAFINQMDENENRYDDENYDTITQNGSYDKDTTTTIYGGTLQTGVDLGGIGRFTLGLSAEKQTFESKGFIVESAGGGGGGGGGSGGGGATVPVAFDDDWHVRAYTASLEYELYKTNPYGLVLGYSHHWFDKETGDNQAKSSFLIGAHYDISKDLRTRGSFARKIRFPSIRQLYEEDTGNPDLAAEESYNWELGLAYKLPADTKLAITYFLTDVEDYIEKIPPVDRFVNNDKYRFQGFELTAETRFIGNLLLRAAYSYLYTRDRSPGSDREELQYRPEHKVTVEGKYSFDFGFSAYVNLMYLADQYFYSETTPLQKEELDDYVLVNMKLEQALFNQRLHLYLGVGNLFDEDYEEAYAFPGAGRTIYGGIDIDFW